MLGEQVDPNGWALAYEVHHAKTGRPVVVGMAYRKDVNLLCRSSAEDEHTLEQAKQVVGACLSLKRTK